MPCSIGLMTSRGIAPPTIWFSKTKSWPGSAGFRRIFAWPYWPRPPVWRSDRSSPCGPPAALVLEAEVVAGLRRLQAVLRVAVLAAAAGLADEPAFALRLPGDRLAIRDLRLSDVRADVELAPHAVRDDLEVELPHSADDRLTRLAVRVDLERRVFLHQLREGHPHLFLVGLGLGLDRNGDDRIGDSS